MAESQNNIIKSITDVLAMVEEVSQKEFVLRDMIAATGWDLDELAGFNISDMTNVLAPLSDDLQALLLYIETPPKSFTELDDALSRAQSAFSRLTDLKTVLENLDLEGPSKDKLLDFSKDLLNILSMMWLRGKSPLTFDSLYLLTLVDYDNADLVPVTRADGKIVRHSCIFPKMKLGRISEVFGNPREYFSHYYFPNGLQTDEDALMAAHKLFPRVQALLQALNIN